MEVNSDSHHDDNRLVVTLTNTGTSIAFFVEVVAVDQETSRRVVPIFWSDNYGTLLPGEQCNVETAMYYPLDDIKLLLHGWNIPSQALLLT
jgi:mannosylglycoprotein endo-beta-mannosidase